MLPAYIILTIEHIIGLSIILGGVIGFTLRTGWIIGSVKKSIESHNQRLRLLENTIDKMAKQYQIDILRKEVNTKLSAMDFKIDAIYQTLIDQSRLSPKP